MIEESGTVVENREKTVLIKARRGSSCESCASKKACHGADDILIEAENPVGAKAGDRVIFTAGAGSILKAGVLLYLVPIFFFITGVILGQTASERIWTGANPDLISGALGFSFLAIAFAVLKVYSKIIEKKRSYRPHVLRVI